MSTEADRSSSVSVRRLTDNFVLGEGPHWDVESQVLYFVDIPSHKFFCYDPATGNVTNTYIKNGRLGVAVPVAGKKNTFVGGAGTDVVQFVWDPKTNDENPEIKVLATADGDPKLIRFNDGKVDPRGRFWAGTMGLKLEPKVGSLYRIGTDKVPEVMLTDITISNGLTWSHDNKTFYYIDSPLQKIFSFDYDDATGDICNNKVLFDLAKNNLSGMPDGMTIDAAGNLWIALWGGGKVISVDAKTGNLLRSVEIPNAKLVTSVAFGGPNLDILYVTTAKETLSSEELKSQPDAGCLFAIEGLGVKGTPMRAFKM